MIPVAEADEPGPFDAAVRMPGLRAIAELVGEPTAPRTGRPRKDAGTYPTRDSIPPHVVPAYWTEAMPDLRERYHDRCAYLALHLHKPGKASVDHYVPKSKDWRHVYEWRNYRLCDPVVNGTRGNRPLHFDPFTVEPGLFALEFDAYQVVAGPCAHGAVATQVDEDIDTLGLNLRGCREAREAYIRDYRIGPPVGIALEYLERKAPFIAQELRRQGLLVRGDT